MAEFMNLTGDLSKSTQYVIMTADAASKNNRYYKLNREEFIYAGVANLGEPEPVFNSKLLAFAYWLYKTVFDILYAHQPIIYFLLGFSLLIWIFPILLPFIMIPIMALISYIFFGAIAGLDFRLNIYRIYAVLDNPNMPTPKLDNDPSDQS